MPTHVVAPVSIDVSDVEQSIWMETSERNCYKLSRYAPLFSPPFDEWRLAAASVPDMSDLNHKCITGI